MLILIGKRRNHFSLHSRACLSFLAVADWLAGWLAGWLVGWHAIEELLLPAIFPSSHYFSASCSFLGYKILLHAEMFLRSSAWIRIVHCACEKIHTNLKRLYICISVSDNCPILASSSPNFFIPLHSLASTFERCRIISVSLSLLSLLPFFAAG